MKTSYLLPVEFVSLIIKSIIGHNIHNKIHFVHFREICKFFTKQQLKHKLNRQFNVYRKKICFLWCPSKLYIYKYVNICFLKYLMHCSIDIKLHSPSLLVSEDLLLDEVAITKKKQRQCIHQGGNYTKRLPGECPRDQKQCTAAEFSVDSECQIC